MEADSFWKIQMVFLAFAGNKKTGEEKDPNIVISYIKFCLLYRVSVKVNVMSLRDSQSSAKTAGL